MRGLLQGYFRYFGALHADVDAGGELIGVDHHAVEVVVACHQDILTVLEEDIREDFQPVEQAQFYAEVGLIGFLPGDFVVGIAADSYAVDPLVVLVAEGDTLVACLHVDIGDVEEAVGVGADLVVADKAVGGFELKFAEPLRHTAPELLVGDHPATAVTFNNQDYPALPLTAGAYVQAPADGVYDVLYNPFEQPSALQSVRLTGVTAGTRLIFVGNSEMTVDAPGLKNRLLLDDILLTAVK